MIHSKREKGKPSRTPFQTPEQPRSSGAQDGAQKPEDIKERMRRMMADPNALEMAMKGIVTNNMGDGFVNGEDVWGELSEETISHLDLVGYNYFFTRYDKDQKKYPDRVICATETHALTTYDYYQEMMAHDNVIGDFIWTAYDNLGEAGAGRVFHALPDLMTGMLGPWPWLSCYQGDLDLDGNRRPQSYFRKIMWGKDDGVHVFAKDPAYAHLKPHGLGWQWNDVFQSWTWDEKYIGQDIYVEAYADCDEIEFIVNGRSCGKAPVEKLTASMILTYEPGTLKAVAYRGGKTVAEDELRTAGAPAAIELTADRTAITADGMDLSFIRARVMDADGVTVPADDIELTAAVTDAAAHDMAENSAADAAKSSSASRLLAGFGSGNPCTDEDYGTGRRRTWQGLALLCVRALKVPGEITVTVEAEGLPAATVSVTCS